MCLHIISAYKKIKSIKLNFILIFLKQRDVTLLQYGKNKKYRGKYHCTQLILSLN